MTEISLSQTKAPGQETKGSGLNKVTTLTADASRRAALLVAYMRQACVLLAPCLAGASTPKLTTLLRPEP